MLADIPQHCSIAEARASIKQQLQQQLNEPQAVVMLWTASDSRGCVTVTAAEDDERIDARHLDCDHPSSRDRSKTLAVCWLPKVMTFVLALGFLSSGLAWRRLLQ
jgi:hypothetical protein